MVQNFSYDFGDPRINIDEWDISFQIITFENTYGLDPERVQIKNSNNEYFMTANRLMWAGNQEKSEGKAEIRLRKFEGCLKIDAFASHKQKIRTTKIILRNLPDGVVLGNGWEELPIGNGHVLNYPFQNSLERIHTPLLFLKTIDGNYFYFRSLDTQVRRKGFAIYYSPFGDGVTVELLHDDLATEMSTTTSVPSWIVGSTRDPDRVVKDHMMHLETHFDIVPWERNQNVPDWLKQIGMVAYIHGQHWSGYIFNDYKEILNILKRLTKKISGDRILAHLAGWEGRYYWKYGDYKPDPRMGGESEFSRLCEGANDLGVRIQLMLGGNCANMLLPGFKEWGDSSYLRTAGGAIWWGNKPDWDTSRTHDSYWQAWLNPGAPKWQQYLFDQASYLINRYKIDSIFLDTYGCWSNDSNYPVFPGLLDLRKKLLAKFPNVFLTGEQWWDVLSAVSPMAHDDSLYLARWPEIFSKYNRGYAFNGWGDPSRNSTGVFEGGWNKYHRVPDAKHLIPTLICVDKTLDEAPKEVEAVIHQAQEYIKKYIK